MSVWYAIPSARPPADALNCLSEWRDMGYRVAAAREDCVLASVDHMLHQRIYPGYPVTVALLVRDILELDPKANIIVTGGDDLFPDPDRSASAIEAEFIHHFSGTLGIMQPTGDRWPPRDASGRYGSERVCGSPWLGREWCERAYKGEGPLFLGYLHFFADEELQEVASSLGLLWQRPDLVQFHDHWMRVANPSRPEHLGHLDWTRDLETFRQRKANGFPGSALAQRTAAVS